MFSPNQRATHQPGSPHAHPASPLANPTTPAFNLPAMQYDSGARGRRFAKEDPAIRAARRARQAEESRILDNEWQVYPQHRRPRTRREELRRLPALCDNLGHHEIFNVENDEEYQLRVRAETEEYDRQNRTWMKEQEERERESAEWGLRLEQGRVELRQSLKSYCQHVDEYLTESEDYVRGVAKYGEGVHETSQQFAQYGEQAKIYNRQVDEYGQAIREVRQEAGQLAQGVTEFGATVARRRHRIHNFEHEGQSSF